MDKISVVIPTYNREKTIEYCIKSIIQQTLRPYEIIIVDDCSKDNTINIIEKMNIENLKVIKLEKNSGAQAARKRGVIEARGEWIAFQDSDDEWMPNRLKKTLSLAKNKKCEVVYSDCLVKDYKNDKIYTWNLPNVENNSYKKLLNSTGPMFQSMLAKRECFIKNKIIDENVIAYQEWDTFINISKNYKIGYINEPLFIYHLHEGETISKNSLRGARGYEYIVNKNKNDIIKLLGKEKLLNHYKRIIEMYSEAEQIEKAKEYEVKSIELKYEIIKEGKKVVDSNLILTNRYKKYYSLCNEWINILNTRGSLVQYFEKRQYKKIYIYSDGELTHRLIEDIGEKLYNLEGIVVKDKINCSEKYMYYTQDEIDKGKDNLIIITPIYAFEEIKNDLSEFFKGKIISIEDIINELKVRK